MIVGSVFYAVRVALKESRRSVLPRTSCFSPFSSYRHNEIQQKLSKVETELNRNEHLLGYFPVP
jgi:hypothetical protein